MWSLDAIAAGSEALRQGSFPVAEVVPDGSAVAAAFGVAADGLFQRVGQEPFPFEDWPVQGG